MDLESIYQRLARNEETASRFHQLESRLLTILNFRDFFENLLTSLGDLFDIPFVWLTAIRGTPLAASIGTISDSPVLSSRTSIVEQELFSGIVGHSGRSVLANTDLLRFSPLLPKENFPEFRSIAITPLTLEGTVVGSLNQADPQAGRFEPGINTDLLERLALKISLCLMNVSAHEQIRFLAFHDTLTGLLNRRVMETILRREFDRARRYGSDLAVVFMDLDRFKRINDTHGHDVGDAALVHLAEVLESLRRSSDVVARFAGDEFVALLPSTDPEKAGAFARRILDHLAETPLMAGETPVFLRLSYGIASTVDPDAGSPASLLKLADQRLFEAKKRRP
jgi:diguanylate cyclase (GGDEF)-like protein